MPILAHARVGSGPKPVLLLHGFLGSRRNLSSLARRWSAKDKAPSLLLLDLTGHGESPPLPPSADLSVLAGDVRETAFSAGLPAPWRIVGHSLGGRAALRALDLFPNDISQVALLDISPSPATERSLVERTLERLLAAPAESQNRESVRSFLLERGEDPATADWLLMNLVRVGDVYRWRVDRPALSGLHARTRTEDLWAVVSRDPGKVLVVRGGASPFVSDADARRLRALGCPVITLPGAPHNLHSERPDELLSALAQHARSD
jgi:pimeloyl-ACP methyl ester carboxylesterase